MDKGTTTAVMFHQLIVPPPPNFVMNSEHETLVTRRQGVKNTTDRVTTEFYWPRVQAEISTFVNEQLQKAEYFLFYHQSESSVVYVPFLIIKSLKSILKNLYYNCNIFLQYMHAKSKSQDT